MRGRGGCNREKMKKMNDNVMSNCHLVTTFPLLQFKKSLIWTWWAIEAGLCNLIFLKEKHCPKASINTAPSNNK